MQLETLRPDPAWDRTAHEDTVRTFRRLADELTIRVWGGDWCIDCRALLPGFAAAMAAAGIDPERIEQYAVKKAADGSKVGPGVDAFGIEYIPTIVVERDEKEVARFVESESEPPATYLARQLGGFDCAETKRAAE